MDTREEAYEWLAPRLVSNERLALDRITAAAWSSHAAGRGDGIGADVLDEAVAFAGESGRRDATWFERFVGVIAERRRREDAALLALDTPSLLLLAGEMTGRERRAAHDMLRDREQVILQGPAPLAIDPVASYDWLVPRLLPGERRSLARIIGAGPVQPEGAQAVAGDGVPAASRFAIPQDLDDGQVLQLAANHVAAHQSEMDALLLRMDQPALMQFIRTMPGTVKRTVKAVLDNRAGLVRRRGRATPVCAAEAT